MLSTNLDETRLKNLNDVLRFVMNNEHSDFYQQKLKNFLSEQPLKDYASLCKLPILSKNELIDLPFAKRSFVPTEQITSYNISSGTTSRNRPTIIPQAEQTTSSFSSEYNFDHKLFEKLKIGKILILLKPFSPGFLKALARPKKFGLTMPGDISNLKLTAQIAQEVGIEGIITSPTLLDLFLIELNKINFDLKQLKFISLGSEFCSTQKAQFLQEKLPNALLRFRYYCSEANMVGYRCPELDHQPPNIFHPAPAALVEIVDDEDQPLSLGESGHLLFTSLEQTALPLIRYRMNDVGALHPSSCSCGQKFVLDLGGRKNFDAIRFYGINLMRQTIEDSLTGIRDYFTEKIEMHIYEELQADSLKPRLELHLELKNEHRELMSDYYFKEMVKEKASAQLRLSAKSSLADLVKENFFLPLDLILVDRWPEHKGKQQVIISHLN